MTYFMEKSNWVAYTFDRGKPLQKPFNGENLQQRTKIKTVNEKHLVLSGGYVCI